MLFIFKYITLVTLVRFQMVSLEFFIDIILPSAVCPRGQIRL